MKGSVNNVIEAIGNTPIVKLDPVFTGVKSEIYVKLEYLNPGGSIKDRIGSYILDQALKKGLVKPGGTIIEGTSGNTGVGIAMWAALNKMKCIFVLADKQSKEKIDNLRAFGAKVVVCPTNVEPEDPRSYYSVSKRLSETIPNSYYVNQYENLWNRETHFHTTGPEIYKQTGGEFDIFMAGVGTGGTISGTAAFLKTVMPEVKVVGVDCVGSIVAQYAKTGDKSGAHSYVLEGLGEDFIPGNYNFDVIDDWVVVDDKESFIMTRKLLSKQAIYSGGSSGAAIAGAIRYAKNLKEPKKILVILPDSGNRYSSKIFNDDWMSDNGYKESTFNVQIKDAIEEIGKNQNQIFSLPDTASLGDAIKLMNEKGISQVPIMSGEEVKGVLSEKDLLKPLYDNEFSINDSVSLLLNSKFIKIEETELISQITDNLLNREVVLITKGGKPSMILTNIDILEYISKHGTY